jgi:hypothetical protein
MPYSKLSPEQRCAKAAEKGQAVLSKADMHLVIACVKYHGVSAICACNRALVELKYIVDNKIVKNDHEHAPMTGLGKVPAKGASKALLSEGPRPAPALGETWGTTKVAVLRQAIADVEPIICSTANLRVLAKKHARDLPLTPVLEIWEFLFGLDPCHAPPAFEDYAEFLDFLQGRKYACGDRANSLCLPPNWLECCVYSHEIVNQTIKVSHCFLGSVVQFQIPSGAPSNLEVSISWNFSERRAVLHDSSWSIVNEVCYAFFSKRPQQNEAPKKRRVTVTPSPLKGEAEADGVGLGGGKHVSPGASSLSGRVETVEAGSDRVDSHLGQAFIGHAPGSTRAGEITDSEASFRPPLPLS